jgi:hypothetical protein
MPKYRGENSEVRIATTEADLETAPVIPNVQSIEWDFEQNIDAQPKGLGQGRGKDVSEGHVDITGTIVKWYDTEPVVLSPGTTTFEEMVQGDEMGPLGFRYIKVIDTDTGEVHVLKKVKGKYHPSRPLDGYKEETYDFVAEEVTKT